MITATTTYTRPNTSTVWFHESIGATIPSAYFKATFLDTGLFATSFWTQTVDDLSMTIVSTFPNWDSWYSLEADLQQTEYNIQRDQYCTTHGQSFAGTIFSEVQ